MCSFEEPPPFPGTSEIHVPPNDRALHTWVKSICVRSNLFKTLGILNKNEKTSAPGQGLQKVKRGEGGGEAACLRQSTRGKGGSLTETESFNNFETLKL